MKFQKSSFCATNACVEVARAPSSTFVRDSKEENPTPICFNNFDFKSFIEALKENKI